MRTKAIATTATHRSTMRETAATFLLAIAIYCAFCAAAYACTGGETTPMGTVLCTVVDFIYGNMGRGLATLAIVTLGVGALLGKTSWGMAITVGVGISVIFNAETIASLLVCGGAQSLCD